MFCKKCGYKLDEDSVFCSYCGTKQTEIFKPLNEEPSESKIVESKTENEKLDFDTSDTKENKIGKSKNEKYDLSYKKESEATFFGVIYLIGLIIISIYFGHITDKEEHNKALAIISLLSLLMRIICVVWAVKIAKRQNRAQVLWGIFTFVSPIVALIIIGQLKRIKVKGQNLSNYFTFLIISGSALILLVFSIIFLTRPPSSVKRLKNDLTEKRIIGKVKTITEFLYSAREVNGQVYKDTLKTIFTYNYNNDGNIITEVRYYTENGTKYKNAYNYDEKGNKIEDDEYGSNGILEVKYIYKYDDKDNNIEDDEYGSNGILLNKHIYKYDDKDNNIEDDGYDSNGNLDGKYIYKYDGNGNEIEYDRYNRNGNLSSYGTHAFNNNGELIESIDSGFAFTYDYSITKWTSSYDNRGNIIEHIWYARGGHILIKETHKYEFDNTGNWIKDVELPPNEISPPSVIERKIEYY